MPNIESTKDGLVEKSTGRKIESPMDAFVSLETCSCDKTSLHDCICPFCRLRYLEHENKCLKDEIKTSHEIEKSLLSQIRDMEKHMID